MPSISFYNEEFIKSHLSQPFLPASLTNVCLILANFQIEALPED